MIYLRSMTNLEFDNFKMQSQNTYAAYLAKVEGISVEETRKWASDQFNKLVPDGLQSVRQFFYQVFEKGTNQPVGYVWLGLQERFGRQIMSINDITIWTSYRGKGFGKILMSLIEQESKKREATRIRLHVFNQNEVAKGLYLSMGFEMTSIDMKKEI